MLGLLTVRIYESGLSSYQDATWAEGHSESGEECLRCCVHRWHHLTGSRDLTSQNRDAKHEAMPVLVRALDNLLGTEDLREEDGIYEREFRLILNIIYLQLLFTEDDREVIKFLEQGCGRMGASLCSLLFEAAMNCLDTDRILPIKKVILLFLRLLQRLLVIPDKVLYPLLEPRPGDTISFQRPRVMDFQAFTSLHSHQRQIRAKYSGSGYPAAVEEGLRLAEQYEDEFLASYSFHPSELDFMRDSEVLKDAFLRYEELRVLSGSSSRGGRLLSRKTRKALRQELNVTDIHRLAAATASSYPSAGVDAGSASTSRESSLSSSIRSQASVGSAVTEVPLEPEGVFKAKIDLDFKFAIHLSADFADFVARL
eukprot:s1868_g9.t1